MMVTTHAVIGLLIGTGAAAVLPGTVQILALAGIIGGILPDLDILFQHRKTLHFPIFYSMIALLSTGGALWQPGTATTATATFITAAAIHSLMDIFGGDLTQEPWKQQGYRGVYDHVRQDWIHARRRIPYDGAPNDLAVFLAITAPLLLHYTGPIQYILIVLTTISLTYTAFRKDFVALFPDALIGGTFITILGRRCRDRLLGRQKTF
ncbi:MAG: metal-dependent hydrolase [Candidatus Nanohaloarchaea archaeon]|nr:metal-dependent hydrolase [Candidatus Nanohaloarchaea archaeon]